MKLGEVMGLLEGLECDRAAGLIQHYRLEVDELGRVRLHVTPVAYPAYITLDPDVFARQVMSLPTPHDDDT